MKINKRFVTFSQCSREKTFFCNEKNCTLENIANFGFVWIKTALIQIS